MEYIKTILKKEDINESIKKDFLEHIQFMQHERLIHLLVTMLFASLLMFGFIIMLIYFSWILVVFTAIIFFVEIFYIFHYYKLENGVQKMYRLYDELIIKK
jgi:ABC-type multidrug transport system fused ATPase/permease subunit